MSSNDAAKTPSADWNHGEQDLGPLAWVLDELRKSLDGAVKAMRRFVHEAEIARGSDLASLDAGPLRIARQQLHQASGALEMVGMGQPALLLRAMEAAVQKFVQRPELCTDEAAVTIERASFALVEYLQNVLAGKPVSAVALFPQYRDAQALAGAERVHPADLWPVERRFREPELEVTATPLPYGAEARAQLDTAVLRLVKTGDLAAARQMHDISLRIVAAQSDRQARAFWKISAGFFEAFSQGLIPPDVYVKRVASRVLMQYAALAKGETTIADRLVQDLLFFCSQAKVDDATVAPALQAVRHAFALHRFKPVEYEKPRYGLFDPALLAQARKRIAAATETWSALAGGDRNKLKPAADQFSLVCDSLSKLHPGSDSLARALTRAVELTTRSGEPPSAALAMEVATSVLYLQATFEELDSAHEYMEERAARLAERLDRVSAGGDPEPLELWMEELYRRVSDHQTMGSVVDELRATLGEAEKAMDQFFRHPSDLSALSPVPSRMAQMRGVLSVLGLDQASLAVVRMRDTVERLLLNEVPEDQRHAVFEKLGNSFGALGFLIDMLSYQRTMARKLFVYDEELGELRILMGRSRTRASDEDAEEAAPVEARAPQPLPDIVPRISQPQVQAPSVVPPTLPEAAEAEPLLEVDADTAFHLDDVHAFSQVEAPVPVPAPLPLPATATAPAEEDEDDLLDIFLEEAREVVVNGLAAIEALRAEPGDLSEQTTLRRAFHTLKGSSRMVGLADFGEAAWAMEQALNAWLAEQKPMQPSLLQLSDDALRAFGHWAEAIAAGDASAWRPEPFRVSADAMRADGRLVPLDGQFVPPAEAVSAVELGEEIPSVESPTTASPSMPVDDSLPDVFEQALQADDVEVIDFADTTISLDTFDAPVPPPAPVPVAELADDVDFALFAEDAPLPELLPADVPAPMDLSLGEDVVLDGEPLPPAIDGVMPGADAPAIDFLLPTDGQTVSVEHGPEDARVPVADVEGGGTPVVEISAEPEPEPEPELPTTGSDDAVKVIDTLRISIPLYNVYLNEADEWSRRLSTSLQEWALELHEPLPDSAVALAHSLAGSSATVGFDALSQLARTLEHALQHVQLQPQGSAEQSQVFLAAADDVRRLLHQFAAGFLKDANPQVLDALNAILHTEIHSGLSALSPHGEMPLANVMEPVSDVPATQDAAVERGYVAPALSVVPDADQQIDDAIARAVALGGDMDDDIDALDLIDPDLFPIFEEEAVELLPGLGAAFRQWAARPENLGARSELLRALHTLKGSSRLAGAMRLGEMAHRLESAVEQVDMEAPRAADIEPLLGHFDSLQASFEALRAISAQAALEDAAITAAPPTAADAAPSPLPPSSPAGAERATASVVALPAALLAPVNAPIAMPRAAANQSVRVRAQLLDRLVNQAGEVMIARSRLDARMGQMKSSLGDLSGNLDRLRQQLRDIEVQAESQMQSRLALSKDTAAGFDPLEFDRFTRVQELTRMMAESVNDVATVQRNLQRAMEGAEDDLIAQGRQARELQRDLLRTRMVEFDGISERLYAVVRQSSKETGKQIKLDISGGAIEMDRGVLDRMTPAFEHLLRNCVAHGIELPEVRTAVGKVATGTITVALQQAGNDVSVEFRDDGAGLDLERIRAKAVAQGLIADDVPVGEAEAAHLVFLPGFSTATEVTGLSGRGIGMDVVRSEVNALGGRIETTTTSGQGTSFRMVLPLTTAVTQVVMLRAGHLTFGVPANVVEIVRRTTSAGLEDAYSTGTFEDGVEALPFYWAGALLQASRGSTEATGKTRPVVIFRSASRRIAVHVDEVLGNQEVVVKNLGPQLSRLPGLAGMSVLASGAVVLIYNPVALATVYGEQVRAVAMAAVSDAAAAVAEGDDSAPVAALAAQPQVPLILVVDDSITVRRVTQRLLQREGYRVSLAADGLQALERLQGERPTVVLSDIEMPRMDGFDLARNIRGDAHLRDLPIIMITSRIAEKHREHAMELGVNHYLGKPYSEEELLRLIQHYVRLAVTEA